MTLPIRFKTQRAHYEFDKAPTKLKEIATAFAGLSSTYGITPTITRVREDAPGQATKVHAAGRALDFRDEYAIADGATANIYTPVQASALVDAITKAFPRADKKTRILHHSVSGSTAHFHIQIAYDELSEDEKKIFT